MIGTTFDIEVRSRVSRNFFLACASWANHTSLLIIQCVLYCDALHLKNKHRSEIFLHSCPAALREKPISISNTYKMKLSTEVYENRSAENRGPILIRISL